MAQISLTILKPANGAVFVQPKDATLPIEFEGQAVISPELAGVQLHFRWYASLRRFSKDAQGKVSQFSLNPSGFSDAATRLSADLPMGSHVITFAASDRSLESELVNSRHGGVTGGVNKRGEGHVIHVLRANIVAPTMTGGNAVTVSSSTRFQAEGPWPFEDDGYQFVNGLCFKWVFDPIPGGSAASGRPQLSVDQDALFCRKPATPAKPTVLELDAETYKRLHGRYRAMLQVEAGSPKVMTSDVVVVEFP